MNKEIIAVSSPSFSRDARLRKLASKAFPDWQLRFCEQPEELQGRELGQFLAGARVAIVGKASIDAPLLAATPSLKAIAKYGVGLDNIDFQACERFQVKVYYRSGVNADAVAELSIGLMLNVMRKISLGDRLLRQGLWKKDGGRQLTGSKVALIGCGAIGSRVARLLRAFACPLYLCDIVDKTNLAHEVDGKLCSFKEAVAAADVISLHVPLTAATSGMINAESLQRFKTQSVLINTSRGAVVDLPALKHALSHGPLGGAGLDVFPCEPLDDPEFFLLPNVVATPHIAGNAQEAVLAMGMAAIEGVQDYILRKK